MSGRRSWRRSSLRLSHEVIVFIVLGFVDMRKKKNGKEKRRGKSKKNMNRKRKTRLCACKVCNTSQNEIEYCYG
jgi:hypothetical protein